MSWGFAHAFSTDEALANHVKVTQGHQGNCYFAANFRSMSSMREGMANTIA